MSLSPLNISYIIYLIKWKAALIWSASPIIQLRCILFSSVIAYSSCQHCTWIQPLTTVRVISTCEGSMRTIAAQSSTPCTECVSRTLITLGHWTVFVASRRTGFWEGCCDQWHTTTSWFRLLVTNLVYNLSCLRFTARNRLNSIHCWYTDDSFEMQIRWEAIVNRSFLQVL